MVPTKLPEDWELIELYLARDEAAIAGTEKKYGRLLTALSERITENFSDAQECVNDTYLGAWNSIPPHRPYDYLYAFLARIVRHLSLDRVKYRTRERRAAVVIELSAEMEACIPAPDDEPAAWTDERFAEVLDAFLANEKPLARRIFLRRYWFMESVKTVAARFGISESRVKSSLFRSRERLRAHLEKEGLWKK